MPPEDNEQIQDSGAESTEEPSTDTPPAGEAAEAAPEGEKATGDKRISDLQSKADKETARANKAEAELARLLARGESPKPGKDPERDALMVELREASLDAVYGEFPELRDFEINRTLIEGTTRAQMRESASSLVGLIKAVETKSRNQTLREFGLTAEPVGASRTPSKSYADMSPEEIEQEIERARNGGVGSLW